ncbi:MAG: hypothetical protein ACFNPZ_07055, partial [Fusobacterium polymorphum]
KWKHCYSSNCGMEREKLQCNLQLIKNQGAAGGTTTHNDIKQGRPLTGIPNISREASAGYQRRKADK